MKQAERQSEIGSWSLHRAYAAKTFAGNIQQDSAYLVTIGFDAQLVRKPCRIVQRLVYPLIFNCLPQCWNVVNETVLGKRVFHKYGNQKNSCGRGLFCIETKSRDGQDFVGPHVHGVFFVDQNRPISPKKICHKIERNMGRLFRKKWPDVDVDVRPLLGPIDREESVKYVTKEPGAMAHTMFREGMF